MNTAANGKFPWEGIPGERAGLLARSIRLTPRIDSGLVSFWNQMRLRPDGG